MKLREIPREMAWLLTASIIVNLASNMYIPFLPLYLEKLGASVEQVGFFFTTLTLMALVFRILGGWVSDTLGRVQTIALGGMVGFIAVIGFAIAPTWGWAMIGALFSEIGISLVAPSFQAYTAEQAPEGSTGSTFGLVNGLFFICIIFGPLLGGFLIANMGYKILLWSAAVIFGIGAAIRLWIARGKTFQTGTLKVTGLRREVGGLITLLLSGGVLLWLFLLDGFYDAGMQVAMPFLPKYVTEVGGLDEQVYGSLFAFMAVISAVSMLPGGMFADRYKEHRSIAVGLGVFATAWTVMILVGESTGVVIAFAMVGIGIAFVNPAMSSLMSKAVPKETLGITYGVFMTALGVMAIPTPYIGGILYNQISPGAPFVLAAGLCVVALPLALWKLRLPAAKAYPMPL